MRIIIDTNGSATDTKVYINGRELTQLIEFHVTAGTARRPKLVMIREIGGQKEPISYFAGDFQKYDEYHPPKKNELK